MHSHDHKTQAETNGSSSGLRSDNATAFQLEDNRPGSIAQGKLKQMAGSNPAKQHYKASRTLADNRPGAKQLMPDHTLIDNRNGQKTQPATSLPNTTGLPDALKSGVESLSGISLSDVKVHYNSVKPVQLSAHAYAQGTDIHVASGQEKYLPHEAWHVVQQKQGRVTPTMQMKGGISVNDDSRLEKEADIMGDKALSAVNPVLPYKISAGASRYGHHPIQRKITIEGAALTLDEIKARFPEKTNDPFMLRGILPAWDALGRTFETEKDFHIELAEVYHIYTKISRISSYKTLSDYILTQRYIQDKIREDPEPFQGLITTAGFEHEFMQMKNGPLRGVSHLVLASSGAIRMPMTGLPFFLETDASNALELVFPPLIVPTVNGSTLPWPGQIKAIDTLIKSHLSTLVSELKKEANKNAWWFEAPNNASMQMLIAGLSRVLGVQMTATPDLHVKRENMSHNTDLTELRSARIDADTFNGIEVGASSKHKGGIDSQVNIAMDMHAAKLLDEPRDFGPDISGATGILKLIPDRLDRLLPTPKLASPALARFYEIMRVKMGSMVAIESQHLVAEFQQAQHDRIGKPIPDFKNLSDEQRKEWLGYTDKEEKIVVHAMLSSLVKDTRSIWIKDHLGSVLDGMLDEDDKRLLAADLMERRHISLGPLGKFDAFNGALQEAVMNLLTHLLHSNAKEATSKKEILEKAPRVSFMEHDPAFIGARQDTYIPGDKVQLPKIWNKKLHVVELRKSNLDLLEIAYKKLTGSSLAISPEVIDKDPEKNKPEDVGEEQWLRFVHLMRQVEIGEINHNDLPPLHIGVDTQTEKEIDRKKGLLTKSETDSKVSGLSESKAISADTHSSSTVLTTEKDVKKTEPPEKKAEPADPKIIKVIPNAGGGDCLFHALAGRNLARPDLSAARTEVAEIRRAMDHEDPASNASQIAMALYQSGVPVGVVRELTLGRHEVPNAVYAALQEIPGMYAGEEELIQWCAHHRRTVAVVFEDGAVVRFDGAGRHPVAIDPAHRYAQTLSALRDAHLSLYKTPNHWERIINYNDNDVPR